MAIRHDTTAPRSSLWDNDHVGDLNDLDDVDAGAPTDGQALTYNSSSGNWEPSEPTIATETIKDAGRWEPVQFDDGTSPWPFVYFNDEIVMGWVTD